MCGLVDWLGWSDSGWSECVWTSQNSGWSEWTVWTRLVDSGWSEYVWTSRLWLVRICVD